MATLTAELSITKADPLGHEALALLREAAIEARERYPESTALDTSWPTNDPTLPRGIYLVARAGGKPVASGALRPLSKNIAEVRRVFVTRAARGNGLAMAMLRELEFHAARFGYETMWLETGNRQFQAVALYEKYGFKRIQPFGQHINDPTSVCFGKSVQGKDGV
jgi:putative acetyltransferase